MEPLDLYPTNPKIGNTYKGNIYKGNTNKGNTYKGNTYKGSTYKECGPLSSGTLQIYNVTIKLPSTTNESQINNRSCNLDSDCVNNPKNETSSNIRSGDFMCINNSCKFVVAAGQNCRDVTDCVAYHYSHLRNISLDSDICSPKNCNFASKCDRAWDQKDIFSIPKIEDQSTCCIGLDDGMECEIVANDVDPCNSNCNYYDDTNSKKCGNKNQKNYIWIGVVICLIGSATLNIGLNVQKYAFTKHQRELDRECHSAANYDQNKQQIVTDDNNSTHSKQHSTLYKKLEKFMFWKQIIVSPLWVCGFIVYVIGSFLSFVALKFAPQSLIAPLGVVSLVVNLLIAPILHNQRLTMLDSIGVIIIIIGSVIITIFSGVVIQDYELCVLIELFKRPQTIIYLTVIGVFIFSLYTFIRIVEKNAIQKDKDAIAKANAVVAELSATENTPIPTIHNLFNYRLSISIDENNKTLTEDINRTLSSTIDETKKTRSDVAHNNKDDSILTEEEIKPFPRSSIDTIRSTRSVVRQRNIKEKVLLPLAYAILASTIGQVYWINMGLKKYDALLQVPIFYCNWSLFDIIGGGIYYDEFLKGCLN
ncbi:92_t:CDS:10 [Rhizophagus irregularis]|nr:92_t:CDS:10 [Rhizophagus irregularis]